MLKVPNEEQAAKRDALTGIIAENEARYQQRIREQATRPRDPRLPLEGQMQPRTFEEFIGNPEGRNVPVLTERFTALDKNSDGKLTPAEFLGKATE